MLRICYVSDDSGPRVVFAGQYSLTQAEHTFEAVVTAPGFDGGNGFIVDVQDSETILSNEELRDLAAFLAQRADAFGHRVAVVVASASPAHYGVARAFEAHPYR